MNKIQFKPANHSYLINDDNEYRPVLNVIPDFPPERFSLIYLYNDRKDYGENSIYQVMVKPNDVRIGWIFPGQALFSNEHDYAEDKFFCRYAYVALYKLLESNENIDNDEMSRKVFLVIDSENTSQIQDFNIDDYIISLYSFGYTFSGKGNLFSIRNITGRKKLYLKPLSPFLKDKSRYIYTLFKDHIPNAVDEISMFVFLYQIIEILISIIFDETLRKQLNIINNTSNIDIQQEKETFLVNISEKNRIKNLFNKTSIETSHSNALSLSCELLLKAYGQNYKSTVYGNLYKVRCMLVHQCYVLDKQGLRLIGEINDSLSSVIVDMLITYNLKVSKCITANNK